MVAIILSIVAALPAFADNSGISVIGENLSQELRAKILSEIDSAPAPETKFEARRQARRAASRVSDYLNSHGYFDAQITPSINPGPPVQPVITIDPGAQFTLGAIEIDYVDTAPMSKAQENAKAAIRLATKEIAYPEDVISGERQIVGALKNAGYAFAEAEPRNVIGDAQAATIDVTYKINAGPRIRFGKTIYTNVVRTRNTYKERLIPFEYGDIFSPQALAELNARLGKARLYSLYAARLSDTASGVSPDGDEIRDVLITLRERDRYTIATGGSYSTSEGPGVTIEWTRRNATRRGDTLKVSTILAEQQRALGADWNFPNLFGYGRGLTLTSLAGRDETDAYDRESLTLGAQLDIYQSPQVTYALGAASEITRETDLQGERDLQILSVSGGVRLDYANSLLDPTTGWRSDMRVEPGLVFGEEAANFIAVSGQISAYRPITDDKRLVVAARARSGLVYGSETLELPTSRRFFAGGGGSARGYAYQAIGPRDATNTPIGGRGLLEISGEARWRHSEKLGYAAFVDGASVTSRDAPSFSDLQFGVGAGVRYYTAIGPIRLDLATPLNREAGDDPLQVYISIGQAF